jgi:Ulp1 family protease
LPPWRASQTVDNYLELVGLAYEREGVAVFSSFFTTVLLRNGEYNYRGVKSWGIDQQIKIVSGQSKLALFPICVGGVGGPTWILVAAHLDGKVLTWFDCSKTCGEAQAEAIAR